MLNTPSVDDISIDKHRYKKTASYKKLHIIFGYGVNTISFRIVSYQLRNHL